MKKKILSVVMACVMAVSCCSGVMAMAGYNDNLQTTTIETMMESSLRSRMVSRIPLWEE